MLLAGNRHRTVKGSLAPKLVFLVTVGHLSLSHILRMYVNYGGYELDYTGPQMVLVIKLTSFAYSVYDGTRLDKVRGCVHARPVVSRQDVPYRPPRAPTPYPDCVEPISPDSSIRT